MTIDSPTTKAVRRHLLCWSGSCGAAVANRGLPSHRPHEGHPALSCLRAPAEPSCVPYRPRPSFMSTYVCDPHMSKKQIEGGRGEGWFSPLVAGNKSPQKTPEGLGLV